MIGKKLRAYEITEEIGSGGMATVFRAYQPSMDRHVAIKVIHSNILHDQALRERFQREARLIARLEHPHLLPVYDFDGEHIPSGAWAFHPPRFRFSTESSRYEAGIG